MPVVLGALTGKDRFLASGPTPDKAIASAVSLDDVDHATVRPAPAGIVLRFRAHAAAPTAKRAAYVQLKPHERGLVAAGDGLLESGMGTDAVKLFAGFLGSDSSDLVLVTALDQAAAAKACERLGKATILQAVTECVIPMTAFSGKHKVHAEHLPALYGAWTELLESFRRAGVPLPA
jgi:hypothetical protein